MFIWEKNFKYLKAQQVSQQISIFFKSQFHNEGGDCQKSYFEVFFWQGSHMWPPKISTLTDPPFKFFAHISKMFDKYQMPIFFIEYLGSLRPVRTWLMLFDQNWAKTRPSHFQMFQMLNATGSTDRFMVHCDYKRVGVGVFHETDLRVLFTLLQQIRLHVSNQRSYASCSKNHLQVYNSPLLIKR